MSLQTSRKYCPTCQSLGPATRPGASHVLHLILTVCTGLLWLPVWIFVAYAPGPWRCTRCGDVAWRNRAPRPGDPSTDSGRRVAVMRAVSVVMALMAAFLAIRTAAVIGLLEPVQVMASAFSAVLCMVAAWPRKRT